MSTSGLSNGANVYLPVVSRGDQRLARRAAPVYLKLIDLLRQSHNVAVDETGWKVAGQLA